MVSIAKLPLHWAIFSDTCLYLSYQKHLHGLPRPSDHQYRGANFDRAETSSNTIDVHQENRVHILRFRLFAGLPEFRGWIRRLRRLEGRAEPDAETHGC